MSIDIIAHQPDDLAVPEMVTGFAAFDSEHVQVIGKAALDIHFEEEVPEKIVAHAGFGVKNIACYMKVVIKPVPQERDIASRNNHAGACFADVGCLGIIFTLQQPVLVHVIDLVEVGAVGMLKMDKLPADDS